MLGGCRVGPGACGEGGSFCAHHIRAACCTLASIEGVASQPFLINTTTHPATQSLRPQNHTTQEPDPPFKVGELGERAG